MICDEKCVHSLIVIIGYPPRVCFLAHGLVDFFNVFDFVVSVSNYCTKELLHAASWWHSCSWRNFDCNRFFLIFCIYHLLLFFYCCMILMFLLKYGAQCLSLWSNLKIMRSFQTRRTGSSSKSWVSKWKKGWIMYLSWYVLLLLHNIID